MKDEIKEILQEVIDDIWQMNEYTYQAEKLEKVLDYITNLQEENERLKVKLENKLTPDELVSMLNQELVRQNKKYKSRNEKAIEILHNINDTLPLDLILNEVEHSEYVLQGEDKE